MRTTHHLRSILAASLLALTTTVGAADKPSASGTFEYNKKKYTPAYAVAFHEGPFVKVVMSDKPFDPALGKDGNYDDSDLMAHPSASMTITIAAEERELFGIRFRDDKGSGADFRCEGAGLLKVEKMDASSVAGTFKCAEHDVKFDARMLPTPAK
jgi:hypothetical protein